MHRVLLACEGIVRFARIAHLPGTMGENGEDRQCRYGEVCDSGSICVGEVPAGATPWIFWCGVIPPLITGYPTGRDQAPFRSTDHRH